MKLYRFSPIEEEAGFKEALEYVVTQLQKLSEELLGEALPLKTVKLFAHYPDEYEYLHQLVSSLGPKDPLSSDTSFYVETDMKVAGVDVTCLGLRVVDPYRMQVGCGDLGVDDWREFKTKYHSKAPFIREFREDMIELWHPDYDVLGYIV